MKLLMRFDDVLEKISRWGLISCLFGILSMAVAAIVFRWLGNSILWMEPLTRHLVFLSAFLGGSLATSKDVHIKVDVLTKLIEKSSSRILHWCHRNLVRLFCFITCLALTYAGWSFYLSEREFGAPSFLNLHSSLLVGIIPIGMALITLRYFNQLLIGIISGDQRESHRL